MGPVLHLIPVKNILFYYLVSSKEGVIYPDNGAFFVLNLNEIILFFLFGKEAFTFYISIDVM